MPSLITTKTGSGKQSLGVGSVLITELAAKLVVAGNQVQKSGTPGFARVFHSCWYGVGFDAGGSPPDLITHGRYQQVEYEDIKLSGLNVFGDTLFWDISQGTSVEFEVDW